MSRPPKHAELPVHFLARIHFRHEGVGRQHPCGREKSGSLSSADPALVTCRHKCGRLAVMVLGRGERRAA